jgi:hypothetical protein
MSKALLLTGMLALMPVVGLAQVPGMMCPAPSFWRLNENRFRAQRLGSIGKRRFRALFGAINGKSLPQ